MISKNPYYIDEEQTRRLTTEQIRAAKFNNVFLITMMTNLVAQKGENVAATLGQYRARINMGELPCSEAATGMPQLDLGKKLDFLVTVLTNQPSAREKFTNSYFATLIDVIRNGSTGDAKSWQDFVLRPSHDKMFDGKNALTSALVCYAHESMPIGINFSKVIDCLIRKTPYGDYELVDFNATLPENKDTSVQMAKAFDEQLTCLKSSPMFNRNFRHDPELAKRI